MSEDVLELNPVFFSYSGEFQLHVQICGISRCWVLAVVRNLCISGEVASTWFGTVQVQIHDKIRKKWTILFYSEKIPQPCNAYSLAALVKILKNSFLNNPSKNMSAIILCFVFKLPRVCMCGQRFFVYNNDTNLNFIAFLSCYTCKNQSI